MEWDGMEWGVMGLGVPVFCLRLAAPDSLTLIGMFPLRIEDRRMQR